jgi:nucleoid-associated protein YgaU
VNKPLKMLIAVAVLAFAASGLYYAWMTPAGPELDPVEPREPKGPTVLSRTPGGEAREEIVMGAGEMPTPVPVSPEPSGGPPAGAFEPTNPDKVEGFVPDTRPMRQLPDALPGFDPVASDSGSSSAIANASPAGTPPSTPPATGAAAPASTAPATPAAVPAEPTLPSLPPAAPAASPVAPVAAPASASPVAPKPAEPVVQSYTVKEGDTVISIWRSLRGTERGWDALVSANPGLDPARLKIGQVLKVPAATTAAATAAPQVSAAGGPVAGTTYTIRSGDTLSTISAAAYGSARHWNLIHQANQSVIGADPAALKVGTRITIPPKPADGVKSSGAAGGSPTPPSR